MSEEAKKEAQQAVITDAAEQIRKFGHGKLTLTAPIRAGGKDVTELNYDFTKLSGLDFVEAMDADPKAVGGAMPGDDFYWAAE